MKKARKAESRSRSEQEASVIREDDPLFTLTCNVLNTRRRLPTRRLSLQANINSCALSPATNDKSDCRSSHFSLFRCAKVLEGGASQQQIRPVQSRNERMRSISSLGAAFGLSATFAEMCGDPAHTAWLHVRQVERLLSRCSQTGFTVISKSQRYEFEAVSCHTRSDALFCQAYSIQGNASESEPTHSAMSNAIAGVIGALVTLGVVGLAGLLFILIRRRCSGADAQLANSNVKGSISSQGSNV